MIIVGYEWRVLGLRVIPEHKFAPPLIRLFGQWEKQKAFMAVAAAWGDDFFRRKGNPETYPCLPSSLTAHSHNNGNVHYNNYSRPPGLNHPFRDTEKVSCRYWIYDVFSHCHNIIFPLLTHAFLALLHGLIFPFAAVPKHYPWHYWHFGILNVCKSARCAWE